MRSNFFFNKQSGVSLLELLIGMVLGLAVLVGLSSVYISAKQSFAFQNTVGHMQEDGGYALDLIAKELRMAGFAGCRGVDSSTVASITTYFPASIISPQPTAIATANPLATLEPTDSLVTVQPLTANNFIRGYDQAPAGFFSTTPNSPTPSHALFFAGGSPDVMSTNAAMASTNSDLSLSSDPFSWSGKTMTFIASDCSTSDIFQGQLSSTFQLAHDTTQGNSANSFTNATVYGTNTMVMPMQWNMLYAATRSGASTPSLFRVFFDGNSRKNEEELVANVEALRFHYGVNTQINSATTLPTLQPDVWYTSAAALNTAGVANWAKVVAVRVGVMMVGSEARSNADITQTTPTLLGATYSLPSGADASRLRREFSTTVVLRNRVSPR